LSGLELDPSKAGKDLTTEQVFAAITEHNRILAKNDSFSTEPLTLVYRANNVQNMRFVDTPGIIENQGTGRDNREDIKRILNDVLQKPNSKLCVLVEPKEFSTNGIINFCDQTFGGKGKWTENAIVIMTKFDTKVRDARSGSKANKFFAEYHENNIYPYLAITPTLDREDLPPDILYNERKKLLQNAAKYEKEEFREWQMVHSQYRETDPEDPKLLTEISSQIGFPLAEKKMREVMLADTATRLPEVLMFLRKELTNYREEFEVCQEKKKFMDPLHIKQMVGDFMQDVCKRIEDYLDGDLEGDLIRATLFNLLVTHFISLL